MGWDGISACVDRVSERERERGRGRGRKGLEFGQEQEKDV